MFHPLKYVVWLGIYTSVITLPPMPLTFYDNWLTFWEKSFQIWYDDARKAFWMSGHINTMRPEQNGHHLADDICFKKILLFQFSPWFVRKGPIVSVSKWVQVIAWLTLAKSSHNSFNPNVWYHMASQEYNELKYDYVTIYVFIMLVSWPQ